MISGKGQDEVQHIMLEADSRKLGIVKIYFGNKIALPNGEVATGLKLEAINPSFDHEVKCKAFQWDAARPERKLVFNHGLQCLEQSVFLDTYQSVFRPITVALKINVDHEMRVKEFDRFLYAGMIEVAEIGGHDIQTKSHYRNYSKGIQLIPPGHHNKSAKYYNNEEHLMLILHSHSSPVHQFQYPCRNHAIFLMQCGETTHTSFDIFVLRIIK
ncbi:14068_t:CDS:2 [Dentiscutata erythropus]|uniref:14068_t:CDS:1 n=1 Tax=Dentiscutata erythropus TaxID=1348616 RepID=A0A9N9F0V5_9GLOM|nr:14068_t:CDS:2 [Dentiscutata erythropus]